METRANYALIGAFVLMAAVTVIGFVLWLGSSQFNREFAEYDVVFQGPVTLEEGASVRYIGIKVGEVESVRIDSRDASKVRARLRIDRATPIKSDSIALIDFAGITGVTFVQITAGSENAGPLLVQPYETVAQIQAGPTPLAALFDGGAEIIGRAGDALEQASHLLSDENIEAIGGTLQNLNTITGSLAADEGAIFTQATDTLASFERAGNRISVASDAATAAVDSIQSDVTTLNTDLRLLIAELNTATAEANLALIKSQEAISAATVLVEGAATDTLTQSRLAAEDLRQLTARLDRIARDLEQNPQGLVLGKARPYERER